MPHGTQGLWRQGEFKEAKLSETFNDEAGFVERADDSSDDDELAPCWKQSAEKTDPRPSPTARQGPWLSARVKVDRPLA
jgi:hypothetical protein